MLRKEFLSASTIPEIEQRANFNDEKSRILLFSINLYSHPEICRILLCSTSPYQIINELVGFRVFSFPPKWTLHLFSLPFISLVFPQGEAELSVLYSVHLLSRLQAGLKTSGSTRMFRSALTDGNKMFLLSHLCQELSLSLSPPHSITQLDLSGKLFKAQTCSMGLIFYPAVKKLLCSDLRFKFS